MDEFYDEWGYEYEGEEISEWPRDVKIDEAKEALMAELFVKRPNEVFYGQQVYVLFEDRFFHWITGKALGELVEEGKINSEKRPFDGAREVRFYWSKKNRYWKRQAAQMIKLIRIYSRTELTSAVGHHAEMLFDAALATVRFIPTARDVREYGGARWEETGHNLDRVYERDGVAYGTEVKNSLAYISRNELEIKLRMCDALRLRPLFIMRMAAKSYVEMIRQAGGFALLFKWQLYPFGQEGLAREIRQRMGLPVDCPQAISDGTVRRFLRWHLKSLGVEDV